jgi:hypothetical protein
MVQCWWSGLSTVIESPELLIYKLCVCVYEAPEEPVQKGIPFYDRDEAVRRARHPAVIQAYA